MIRALVTGASGAIGAAIARQLARDGMHVLVHANHGTERAKLVVDDIRHHGGQADYCRFDVTDTATCTQTLEGLLTDGPIQVVIHNAGIHSDAPLAGMSALDWHRVIDVSLHGFYNVVQPLLLPMMATRWGRIVAMSSVAGVLGNRGQANYAAAKAGLHGAVKSLSFELASRGITVNAVAPGIIESPLTAEHFDAERIARLVPMKRVGQPTEVADLVAFLSSERAAYISGQVISINGGMA